MMTTNSSSYNYYCYVDEFMVLYYGYMMISILMNSWLVITIIIVCRLGIVMCRHCMLCRVIIDLVYCYCYFSSNYLLLLPMTRTTSSPKPYTNHYKTPILF